ncbi:MAG: DNA-3-methyladenine glycosylase 2 family protein [Candidatus Dormibacteraeota bacterium]|nr:DNA-3-methyladenine glycosylase 2 family protein [Candidatus Dormibacteraeota bacterium]
MEATAEPAKDDLAAAAAEVARRDPALGRLVDLLGPPAIRPPLEGYFAALVRAIAFQQLAGRAAAAIHGRFLANFVEGLTPEAVLALPEELFRSAGLSAAKTASIRDLAAKTVDGTVPLEGLEAYSDDEIVERLSTVRGIGPWTAEMFLIFQLRRPDVWPVDDFGVRKGYAIAHELPTLPKPKELAALGDLYRPYRTIAAWYCWRANDTVLPTA